MIGDKCESCGVEWADHRFYGDHEYVSEKAMSGEWTSGDRLSIDGLLNELGCGDD